MLRKTIIVFGLIMAAALGGEMPVKNNCKTNEYFEITSPVSATPGEKITITVKVLRCDPGMRLKADAHFFNDKKGYDSFAAWGGNGQEVKAGDTITFEYLVKAKEGCPFLVCIAWLSKDGDFAHAVQTANSETIAIRD